MDELKAAVEALEAAHQAAQERKIADAAALAQAQADKEQMAALLERVRAVTAGLNG
jgi:hypothetical protein